MANIKKIDAHHHLWDLSLTKHSWLIDAMDQSEVVALGNYQGIRKSYLIEDYLILLQVQIP